MLMAVLDPPNRTAELHGGDRDHDLLGIERRLGPEPAADERRNDTDGGQLAFEQVGDGALTDVRRLRCRPHRDQVRGGIMACQHCVLDSVNAGLFASGVWGSSFRAGHLQ
jgi:hypothetical protein